MKCNKCGGDYPHRFIQPMITSLGNTNVDPECALGIKNALHGTEDTVFKGEAAQDLLDDFRQWKEDNTK